MHIDQLPVELLRACLHELFLPVESTERDDLVDRQVTLSRCSLVSRTWRAVAQPLLYERIALVVGKSTLEVNHHRNAIVDDDIALEIPEQVDPLWRTLQTRPDLVQNVKVLRLDKRVENAAQPVVPNRQLSRWAAPLNADDWVHSSLLHRKFRAVFSHAQKLEQLLLYQIKPFDVRTPTLAKGLTRVCAYATDFECFGPDPEPLPNLVSWSGCGLKFDDVAARLLTAEYLPNVKYLAHAFSRANNVDLSSFPSSVRVVCSANTRGDSAAVAETTLYLLRFEALSAELSTGRTLAEIVNATMIRHLCLLDSPAKPARVLYRALLTEPALSGLRTLRIVSDGGYDWGADPTTIETLLKERGIEVIDTGEWTGDPTRGDMFPPGWI